MAGAFQTTRDIFENALWKNVVEFRLFFLIYGKAAFVDGVKIGNRILRRGQWIRSYRNLQEDLEYIENRSVKRYSLSTLHRAIDRLITSDRIKTEESELGTLFEVVNYSKYQGLDNYRNNIENAERTGMEQQENTNETPTKHQRNNNNNTLRRQKKTEEIKQDIYSGASPQKNFIPPSPKEVQAYCKERGNKVDAEKWIDFYTSKGWLVGKAKMKDWKACVRTWEKSDKTQQKKKGDFTKRSEIDPTYDERVAKGWLK